MSAGPSVLVVDYALGNLESVRLALAHVGVEAATSGDAAAVADAAALVLPGVGAFGDAMRALEERGLARALHDFAASGRPLLGICLGMQLLLGESEEFGRHEGLGLVAGRVRRFPSPVLGPDGRYGPGAKVPQVGWNRIAPMRLHRSGHGGPGANAAITAVCTPPATGSCIRPTGPGTLR